LLFVLVLLGFVAAQNPGPGPTTNYEPRERTYFIGIVEDEWNYAPTGQDLVWSELYGTFAAASERLNFTKAMYRQFNDSTFTTQIERDVNETHLGILGPVIRAVVGDSVKIVLKNMARFNFSLAAHGVVANKANDGALFDDGTTGIDKEDDSIHPNETFTYFWNITEANGPAGGDVSSVIYPYHSLVHEQNDIDSGLYGSIIVTRADWADPETAKPLDVDREFVVLFNIFDEGNSLYADANGVTETTDEDTREKYALNGLIFGNLRPLNVSQGEIVRWYVMGAGSDFHTADWHGNTLIFDNRRTIALTLTPAITAALTMNATNPGTWLFYCHVEDHNKQGMATTYTVL